MRTDWSNVRIDPLSRLLPRLWRHLEPKRKQQTAILLVLMVFASFAEALSLGAVLPFLGALAAPERVFEAGPLQPVIRALGITRPHDLLLPLTLALVITALLSGVARIVLLWVSTRVSYAIGADFSISIYRRTLYQPYSVHVSRNSAEVISGIAGKASAVVSVTLLPILNMVSGALMLVTVVAVLIAIQPVIAISAFLGFSAIYAPIILVANKRLAIDSARSARELNQVMKALQEGLGGVRDVLIDGAQEVYCRVFRNADLPLRRASGTIAIVGTMPRYGIEALGIILIAALAYSMADRQSGLAGAIPILGALALGAQRMLPALQQIYGSWTTMRGGRYLLMDALELLEQPLPAYADQPPPPPIPFTEAIRLERLSFRYGPGLPDVLRDIDLTIPKGARVGFVGTTGSGKSTLLDIIMALLQPTRGRLLIDGTEITEATVRAWQARLAHVPQAIFLSDTTIAENIAFAVPVAEIDMARVRRAAEMAQIAAAIEEMPKKYDTVVGERGVRLSGGQRQRIGIARALYKRASVIVLDEATSALDTATETAVMRSIDSLGPEVTLLIVAHRVTTLRGCTHIVEIEEGRLARQGTYDELLAPAAAR